jgi:hypothetical protein
MYLYSTPLEIYLIIVFARAAIGTLLALWAIVTIAAEELHHRRDMRQARARQRWGSSYRPRAAVHEHGPILH